MKTLKKILRIFLLIIAILVTGFIGLLIYAKVTDYKPEEKEIIAQPENPSVLKDSTQYFSFNLEHWLCRTGQGYGFFQGWRHKSNYTKRQVPGKYFRISGISY